MWLLDVCVSPSGKHRPFLNQVVFLLLSCVSGWYILDAGPLSDICHVKSFSILHVNFTVLTVSCEHKRFWFEWCPDYQVLLSSLLLLLCASGAVSKKPLPYPRSGRFMPVLSPKTFCNFNSHSGLWSFWINFCICCEVGVQLHPLALGIDLDQWLLKILLCLWKFLGSFVNGPWLLLDLSLWGTMLQLESSPFSLSVCVWSHYFYNCPAVVFLYFLSLPVSAILGPYHSDTPLSFLAPIPAPPPSPGGRSRPLISFF